MESMQDIKVPVCRLCLEVDCYSNFQQLENGNDLKLVLPDLNYTLTTDPVICSKCREMLQKSSCFKTTCKQTEDYLTNVRINNTSVFNELFNRKLENDTIKGDGGRCRLCMRQSECCSPLCVVKYMLEKCFSEMDMTLVQNPVICNSCIEDLQGHYNLIVSCLDIEDKIRNYHVEKGVTLNNTNLHEMRLSLIKMESYNKNYNRGSDDFISKRIKLEDEFRDMESTIKTEEISIKDEADGEQKISTINTLLSKYAKLLPHKLDHNYSKVNTYSVQKYKSILNRYKFRGRGFHPFSKNRQNVRVILRNIRILNKKIRKNEKIIKDEMKRLQNLEAVLNGLKSDNLDDSTFDILAECENRE